MTDAHTITNLLREVRGGAPQSVERLMGAVYFDLHNIARRAMSRERNSHTLQPTALVHEAYMRLFRPSAGNNASSVAESDDEWKNRAHFYSIAARQMRQILVDHSRKYHAEKRGSGVRVALNEEIDAAPQVSHAIEDIDMVLRDLEAKDPVAGRVVELKFFGGLTDDEVAEVLQTNRTKVRRDWEFARSWLFHQLGQKT